MNAMIYPTDTGDGAAVTYRSIGKALKSFALLFTLCAASAFSAWGKGLSVSAELQPAEIALGDSAQLTITVNGQTDRAPDLPSVPGLSFDHVGQSSQYQIINGAMSSSISHSYVVTPSRPGTFTIPKLKVGNGADAAESNPLVLKVLQRAAAAPRSSGGSAGRSLPDPTVEDVDPDRPALRPDEIGFLRVVTPKKEFYVGETVPAELKACFRAGVELRLDGLPQLGNGAFAMNKLGPQPIRTQELVNGEPFTVFTWPTAITAVKAGDYDMTVEIPTTVTVRQRGTRLRSPFGNSIFDDAFSDSFFDQFFGTATQKQVKLRSDGATVKVLPLPAENRPASFAGAVGQFKLTAAATPTRAAVGDPITLTLNVTGHGNFDRVAAPGFDDTDDWKAYKPSEQFQAKDSAGYEGAKTFEMALLPKQAGPREIPPLEFSYFDPERRQYVVRTTIPIAVEVSSGAGGSAPIAQGPPNRNRARAEGPAPSDGLAPNQLDPGAPTWTLRPWVSNPWLLGANLAAGAGLLAASVLIRRHRKAARDPRHREATAANRAVRLQLQAMESAATQGDARGFFLAARQALRHRLAERWALPAHTITLAEINARMNGEADAFKPIFEAADEIVYSGRTLPAADLLSWTQVVKTELKKLEAA